VPGRRDWFRRRTGCRGRSGGLGRAPPLAFDGHLQCVHRDLDLQARAHAPADDLAGEEVENCGQIQPALAGGDAGEVGEPDLVRHLGGEVASQPVGRDRIAMPAVGGSRAPGQGGQAPQAGPAHQSLDARTSHAPAVAAQHRMHPWRGVGSAAVGVYPADVVEQGAVGRGPGALGAGAPRIVAARRDAQDGAHHPNRPLIAMLIDEPEFHREADPKMTVAFLGCHAPSAAARSRV
jgi:hypothetical protein